MMHYFTDPILRAPTWGCMFMCIASSLMGVMIFLRKKTLLAETLSHAAYPGACLGIVLLALFFPNYEEFAFLAVLGGAFISSFLALRAIHWLELQARVYTDTALCFVLAVFFGFGTVVASGMQMAMPVFYQQVQILLFGQAATMGDLHIWIYGSLAFVIGLFLFLTFCPLKALLFDLEYAMSLKIKVRTLEKALFFLLLLSLVIGIRSVGVVLMSGMVIAPAVFARAFTDRLHVLFIVAGCIGALSGLLGNYLAVEADLPTGPMIVLVGTCFALFALLFAPKRGLCFRMLRIFSFRLRCLEENILKTMWKKASSAEVKTSLEKIALWRLKKEGWVNAHGRLSYDGMQKAALIVRLHRLWELYLTEELGLAREKVHRTAEEMEHILTLEMEEKLTHLLENPVRDPHQQPIPQRRM